MKYIIKILVLTFLTTWIGFANSQSNTSNYLKSLKHYYSNFKVENNYDSIVYYGLKIIHEYKSQNKFTNAINIYDELINFSNENDEELNSAQFSLEASELLTYTSNYSLALKYALNSLENYKKINDSYGLAKTYNSLSILYYYLTHFKKARKFALIANEFSLKLNDKKLLSENYNNLAIIYSALDSIKISQDYNYRSLKIKQNLNDSVGIAKTYANIALNYLKMNDINLAIEFYQKALNILKHYDENRSKVFISVNLGYCYLVLNDTKSAISIANEIKNIIQESNLVDLRALLYLFYSEIYKQTNDYKSAFTYLEDYLSIKDSIFTNETRDKIKELEELISAKQENQILKQENKEHFIWFAIIIILSIIIIISFYLRYLSNKKSKKMLEEKNNKILEQNLKLEYLNKELSEANKAKDKLFNIIAHDLKNPIWWSKNISEILTTNIEKLSKDRIKEIAQVLDDSANTSLHLIDNLLQWSKAQRNRIEFTPEEFNIKSQIDLILEHLKIHYISKEITVNNNINPHAKIFADKNMFNTIFRNILSNAFKFTNNGGKVDINYLEENELQIIIVKDTGVGFDDELITKLLESKNNISSLGTANEKGSGLGLILTKEFVDRHNGQLLINSEKGKGTSVTIKLPKNIN